MRNTTHIHMSQDPWTVSVVLAAMEAILEREPRLTQFTAIVEAREQVLSIDEEYQAQALLSPS